MKAKNEITIMSTPVEEVLKADIMRDIYLEADAKPAKVPPVPTPKQIGGLTNLGKTFIWSEGELEEKRKYAEAQMVQKYGGEIYGGSAQLGSGGSLISCTVGTFVDLTHIKKEAKNNGYKQLRDSCDKLEKFLVDKSYDEKWKATNGVTRENGRKLLDTIHKFSDTGGQADEKNQAVWKELDQILKSPPWNKISDSNKDFKGICDSIVNSWKTFNGGDAGTKDGGKTADGTQHVGKALGSSTKNNPSMSMRIDIKTNFNEDWYKKKFKSGFLNKMIFAIKTDARSRMSPDVKTDMTGHKYTQDEMLPQEKRKLDSLTWKMTNKVCKDYISFLLGWSRKKEYTEDDEKNRKPVQEALKQDTGFGDSMAKKALGGRGILGRLKQKLFSGGQNSNTISVAFQYADPNDGWKFVESKEADLGEDKEGKEGKDGGESGSSKGGSSGSSGGGSSSGAGGSGSGVGGKGGGSSGSSGKGGAGGGAFGSPSSNPELYMPLTADQAQKNPNEATGNLSARVKRLEDEVGITPPTSESIDPFYEDFMEERMELVKEVCEGKADVQTLIEHCLENDWGN